MNATVAQPGVLASGNDLNGMPQDFLSVSQKRAVVFKLSERTGADNAQIVRVNGTQSLR